MNSKSFRASGYARKLPQFVLLAIGLGGSAHAAATGLPEALLLKWVEDIDRDGGVDLCVDGRLLNRTGAIATVLLSGRDLKDIRELHRPAQWKDEYVSSEVMMIGDQATVITVGRQASTSSLALAVFDSAKGSITAEHTVAETELEYCPVFAHRSRIAEQCIVVPQRQGKSASLDVWVITSVAGQLKHDKHTLQAPLVKGNYETAGWVDVGDLDNDAKPELVCHCTDQLWLYNGKLKDAPLNVVLPETMRGAVIGGCCAVPDVDGDGVGDLACGVESTGSAEGRVLWISTKSGRLVAELPKEQWDDGFGAGRLMLVPDEDSDGVPDLLVSRVSLAFGSAMGVIGSKSKAIVRKLFSIADLPPVGGVIALSGSMSSGPLRIATSRYSPFCVGHKLQSILVYDGSGRELLSRIID